MSYKIQTNGDVADATQINENYNAIFKLQGEKAINDVSATNSGVLAGSSQVLIDKFLDSTGQNDTVDTATTTGLYNSTSKYYSCKNGTLSSNITEPSFETITTWTYSETDSLGHLTGSQSTDYVVNGTYSYRLGKLANSGNPSVNDFCQILQSVNFTNINTISFNYTIVGVSIKGQLVIGSTEVLDITSGTGVAVVDVSGFTGTQDLIFRAKVTNTNTVTSLFYVDNVCEGLEDSTIQSVATTVPTGMTKVFVTPLLYEALSTGDNITADVSINGGTNYTTNIPINTWSPITSANGTSLIVKANLLTGDGSTSPKVSGWRVLLE